MHWYYLAFLSPLLWAMSNHIDKYALTKYLKGSDVKVLTIFGGIVSFFIALGILIFAHENIFAIKALDGFILFVNGVMLIIAFIPYYYAMERSDASVVVPLYQTIPIFSAIFGFFLLNETVSGMQFLAGALIIIGAVLISIDLDTYKFRKDIVGLMLLSSFLIALHFLIFKAVAIHESFWRSVFWEYAGDIFISLFLLVFMKNIRSQFVMLFKENSLAVLFVNTFNEGVNLVAKLIANYATLLAPVFIVNLANGVQPLFVFLIGIILTIFSPSFGKEKISRSHIFQRSSAIIILLAGSMLLIG